MLQLETLEPRGPRVRERSRQTRVYFCNKPTGHQYVFILIGWFITAGKYGVRACGRPVVEEVCGATEGASIVSGLFPEKFEEVDRLAMGEDVK